MRPTILGALLEVEMFKKCMPLWREARFEVKMNKTYTLAPLLDFEASFCVAGARESAPWQREQNVRVLSQFQKRWQSWDF